MNRCFQNKGQREGFIDCTTGWGPLRIILSPGEVKELRDVAAVEKISQGIVELNQNMEEVKQS